MTESICIDGHEQGKPSTVGCILHVVRLGFRAIER